MPTIFLNESEDCKWLREVHLKGKKFPRFRSFVLEGSEDCPDKITLYGRKNPDYTDEPVGEYSP